MFCMSGWFSFVLYVPQVLLGFITKSSTYLSQVYLVQRGAFQEVHTTVLVLIFLFLTGSEVLHNGVVYFYDNFRLVFLHILVSVYDCWHKWIGPSAVHIIHAAQSWVAGFRFLFFMSAGILCCFHCCVIILLFSFGCIGICCILLYMPLNRTFLCCMRWRDSVLYYIIISCQVRRKQQPNEFRCGIMQSTITQNTKWK
jgi:hypothetical protein